MLFLILYLTNLNVSIIYFFVNNMFHVLISAVIRTSIFAWRRTGAARCTMKSDAQICFAPSEIEMESKNILDIEF